MTPPPPPAYYPTSKTIARVGRGDQTSKTTKKKKEKLLYICTYVYGRSLVKLETSTPHPGINHVGDTQNGKPAILTSLLLPPPPPRKKGKNSTTLMVAPALDFLSKRPPPLLILQYYGAYSNTCRSKSSSQST